jgi:hypothetical protein
MDTHQFANLDSGQSTFPKSVRLSAFLFKDIPR